MADTAALKVIFAGTPEFAAVALESLLSSQHELVAVYTQPDRPAGRGRKLKPSPVKLLAESNDIPVYQPSSLKDEAAQQQLQALQADVMVVVAYGLILPAAVLAIPRLGCINIHASLLPRWRGAAPIQRAILAGDAESGVTIMQMDEGLDTGAMLMRRSCPINSDDNAQMLHDRLAVLGAEAALEVLVQLRDDKARPETQDDEQANYAHKLSKAEAIMDWNKSAPELDRQVRAFNPWPVAQTRFNDEVVRVWQAIALSDATDSSPGQIVATSKQGIDVATTEGLLRLQRLQLPGGKPLAAVDVLNARKELKLPGAMFESVAGPNADSAS